MKDEVTINMFKELYQLFMTLKARKCSFYISFGDAADQNIAEYRLQDVTYKPNQMKRASHNDVTLVLKPLSKPDFTALIQTKDELRLEFFHGGLAYYFDIKVGFVSACGFGLGFSTKLPEFLGVKQHSKILHLPAVRDRTINMSIGGQHVDVIDVAGGGGTVLIPQANFYDIEVGKAIRHLEIKMDGFTAKANAELCHIRPHANGLKLVVGLRFMFFGRDDEDNLLHLVKQKSSLFVA